MSDDQIHITLTNLLSKGKLKVSKEMNETHLIHSNKMPQLPSLEMPPLPLIKANPTINTEKYSYGKRKQFTGTTFMAATKKIMVQVAAIESAVNTIQNAIDTVKSDLLYLSGLINDPEADYNDPMLGELQSSNHSSNMDDIIAVQSDQLDVQSEPFEQPTLHNDDVNSHDVADVSHTTAKEEVYTTPSLVVATTKSVDLIDIDPVDVLVDLRSPERLDGSVTIHHKSEAELIDVTQDLSVQKKDVSIVYLTGSLCRVMESNMPVHDRIIGTWRFKGQAGSSFYMNTILGSDKDHFPFSGLYRGHFDLPQSDGSIITITEEESDLEFKKLHHSNRNYSIEGRGINKLGSFTITGTASLLVIDTTVAYEIQIRKKYTPVDEVICLGSKETSNETTKTYNASHQPLTI